jgi:5-methylcytosine-specific restriction endonuclease McrA
LWFGLDIKLAPRNCLNRFAAEGENAAGPSARPVVPLRLAHRVSMDSASALLWLNARPVMKYDGQTIIRIYDRTSGYCHICHKKLALKNYACPAARGAWEVDHCRARAAGGSDHGNNLVAACISCNRSKGKAHVRAARSKHGTTRRPKSKATVAAQKSGNALVGSVAGATIGGAVAGPPGALFGAFLGMLFGEQSVTAKS